MVVVVVVVCGDDDDDDDDDDDGGGGGGGDDDHDDDDNEKSSWNEDQLPYDDSDHQIFTSVETLVYCGIMWNYVVQDIVEYCGT